MRAMLILIVLVALLPGCSVVQGWFGGPSGAAQRSLPYRAKLQAGEDRRDFTVTVAARGAPLSAARESARLPATVHCLRIVGISDVDWVLDASGADWATARTAEGDLVVRGRCSARG